MLAAFNRGMYKKNSVEVEEVVADDDEAHDFFLLMGLECEGEDDYAEFRLVLYALLVLYYLLFSSAGPLCFHGAGRRYAFSVRTKCKFGVENVC